MGQYETCNSWVRSDFTVAQVQDKAGLERLNDTCVRTVAV